MSRSLAARTPTPADHGHGGAPGRRPPRSPASRRPTQAAAPRRWGRPTGRPRPGRRSSRPMTVARLSSIEAKARAAPTRSTASVISDNGGDRRGAHAVEASAQRFRRVQQYRRLPRFLSARPKSGAYQAQLADLVPHPGNNEIQQLSGFAGDGETRTRTGDTTIFSRVPLTLEFHGFAGDWRDLRRLAPVRGFPDFASVCRTLRPTSALVGLFVGQPRAPARGRHATVARVLRLGAVPHGGSLVVDDVKLRAHDDSDERREWAPVAHEPAARRFVGALGAGFVGHQRASRPVRPQ